MRVAACVRAAAFTLALATAFTLAACTRVTSADNSGLRPWTIPGTLRIAIRSSPDSLDPLISVDASGRHDVPILAQTVPTLSNGGISRDGLTITYHLRHGVRWQDGAPFTSADVAFSWQAIRNPNNDIASRAGYDLVRTVETPDPWTAVFRLARRYSPAVDTLFGESDTPMFIVPKHLLGALADVNRAPFNAQPIGTGPFRVVRWLRGDRIELEANDSYFLGKPHLRKIFVAIVPSETTGLDRLRAHEIDWLFEPSEQLAPQVRELDGVVTSLTARNEVQEILVSQRSPALRDRRVRVAIASALDRNALTARLTFGTGRVADDEHPPFMWAHTGLVKSTYDPAKARRLLDAAGYRGRRLELEAAYVGSNATTRSEVVLIQAQLRAAGIDLVLKPYPLTLFAAPLSLGGIQASGKFDLGITGWVGGIDPDDSTRYACRSIPPGGDDYTRYCDAQMDAAQGRALDAYDRPARLAAYRSIQGLLARDVPDIFLWWPLQLQAVSADFKGFAPNPVNEAWNAWQWSI